ncbi:MAG: DUF262 domain-containing protein [Agitococcus sp.]
MKPSTTIREMMTLARKITVPSYQRAYAWEVSTKENEQKHVNVFLADLEEHNGSFTTSPYYFGHFLFEKQSDKYCIVDGQQRLTTIVIFVSALFSILKDNISEEQTECFEDMIKRGSTIRFSTVNYDNKFFEDYIINKTKHDTHGLETESAKRIANAFQYFQKKLNNKSEEELRQLLNTICNAVCTTHTVNNESEAIQMFIFQNNRGKKPSKLELLKAQFMHHVHLYAKEDSGTILKNITARFAVIYQSIASIGRKIDEDTILRHTIHVYENTLSHIDIDDFINKKLTKDILSIEFINSFCQELEANFGYLKKFFITDQKRIEIHSLIILGGFGVVLPFILKSYRFGLDEEKIAELCSILECLVLRHRVIGTRADITARINKEFIGFSLDNRNIEKIKHRVEHLKITTDGWWNYWNNSELEKALKGELNHTVAKFLLWKYENHLIKSMNKAGYAVSHYTDIILPELEHIAPTTEPRKPHGYDVYDDEFKNKYLNCLGNYLLVSKQHNCSIGNISFIEKLKTYTTLEQHRELKGLLDNSDIWTKEIIEKRHKKIVNFILAEF